MDRSRPIDLSSLKQRSAEISFMFDAVEWTVVFRPNVYTHNVHRQALAMRGVDIDTVDQVILSMVTDWNITDNGVTLPVNEDTLALLPLVLKTTMANAMVEAIARSGGKPIGRASSATSSRAEGSEPVPIMSAPSVTPPGPDSNLGISSA